MPPRAKTVPARTVVWATIAAATVLSFPVSAAAHPVGPGQDAAGQAGPVEARSPGTGKSVASVFVEAAPRSSQYAVVVRAPYRGSFSLQVTTAAGIWGEAPGGCGPGSRVFEQVLNVEDEAAAAGAPALTRSVLVCHLGVLEAGALRTVTVPAPDPVFGSAPMTAQLHGVDAGVVDRVRWAPLPGTVCAPPDGAPTWVPEHVSGEVEAADTVGAAREAAGVVDAVAQGRISGTFIPGERVLLTGVDTCEQRIDRSVTTTGDGQFAFTGLLPGRYALLDEHDGMLTHVELSVDAPDRTGVEVGGAQEGSPPGRAG